MRVEAVRCRVFEGWHLRERRWLVCWCWRATLKLWCTTAIGAVDWLGAWLGAVCHGVFVVARGSGGGAHRQAARKPKDKWSWCADVRGQGEGLMCLSLQHTLEGGA